MKKNRNKNNLECANEQNPRRQNQGDVNQKAREEQDNEDKFSYEFGNDHFVGSEVNRNTMTDIDLQRLNSQDDYDYEFGYDSYFPNLDNERQYQRNRNQKNKQNRNQNNR